MSIFIQLIKSIYSPKDIAKFRLQGIGKSILYVFLLTFISILPAASYLVTGINNGVNEAKKMITEDLPSFTITGGTLQTNTKKPVIIPKKNFTFIIDSTGELTTSDIEDYPNAIAFLKHQAAISTNYQVQTFDYTTIQDLKITDQDIKSFVNIFDSMLPVFIPLMILFMYIMSAGTKFISITFFALIALILKNTLGRSMRFRHAWIISAYSLTLSTVFFTIMEALRIIVPYGIFLTWFINIMVMYLAIKEIPKTKESH